MPPKKVGGEWIETDTGNRISRRAAIHGPTNIILTGRSVVSADAVLRGDLVRTLPSSSSTSSSSSSTTPAKPATQVAISTGRYVYISRGAILHPPSRIHRGIFSHHPLKIGENVFIGEGAVIQAAAVGNNVWIGKNVVLGNMCIVKDTVKILENTVVPEGMVVPSGWVVAGRPARWVGDVGVAWEGPERGAPA